MNTHCIACAYPITHPIYHPEPQPLAALYLPDTQEKATNIQTFPMNFHSCAACSHIFNTEFDYSKVPYENNSNLMFNHGSTWQTYMEEIIQELHKQYNFDKFTCIEIGCGTGHFLERLKHHIPSITPIGFEPGNDTEHAKEKGIEVFQEYFMAEHHIKQHKPDLLIARHVIEHLDNPKDFITQISHWCNLHDQFPYVLIEVPRINNAIEQHRLNDYLYEHVSNFTDLSMKTMLETSGYDIIYFDTPYNGEVITTLAKPKKNKQLSTIQNTATQYQQALKTGRKNLLQELLTHKKQGNTIALWGGTGKSAAFLNSYQLSLNDFPTVVDSDHHKVGKYVPGTGQEIKSPEQLQNNPVDTIIITTQWRAQDIFNEIQQRKITYKNLYIVQDHKLTTFPIQNT